MTTPRKPTAAFDLAAAPHPYAQTWTYRIFRRFETELNHAYWSNAVIAPQAERRGASHRDSGKKPREVFSAGKEFQRQRANWSMGTWSTHYAHFLNWSRSTALVGICSYFEVFLKGIVYRALQARACGLLANKKARLEFVGSGAPLDGATVRHIKYGILNGDWPSRWERFGELFPSAPDPLPLPGGASQRQAGAPPGVDLTVASQMETSRRRRNSVGHHFGRELEENPDPGLDHYDAPLVQVSEADLLAAFAAFAEAAYAVEQHLVAVVGQYEALHYVMRQIHDGSIPTPGQVNGSFFRICGRSPGVPYCRSLLDYCLSRPTRYEKLALRKQAKGS